MEKSKKKGQNLPAPRFFDPMKLTGFSTPREREAAYSKIFPIRREMRSECGQQHL